MSRTTNLILDAGPFRVGVTSSIPSLGDAIAYFYRDVVSTDPDVVLDYNIGLHRPPGLRAMVRPQVVFGVDGQYPFDPQPLENAFPVFEWGLNWCIATSAHRYMMLHAGTIAFGDHAMILPGTPGSGKSTLSAALHLSGARLLSDEFGLVRPETADLLPLPRGIPLKNASIEAILEFDPAAPLGPTYPKTRKGRVRHLRPAAESLRQQHAPARPRWLVFPKYRAGAEEVLAPMPKVEAFRQLAFNCFNYTLLGETAFQAVDRIVDAVDCYTFTFSRLESAVTVLQALAAGKQLAIAAGRDV
ncbi:MAG: HprK-related kinase A [Gammaproteobacteria bacterium]|nr:HprK-related kinase A [Gammaproteobacteria bacterium]